jgi:putative transposase
VIAYWWNGNRCRLFFRVVGGSYNDEKLISFLEQLMQQPCMGKLILLWDGLPSHRSYRMTEYLRQQKDRMFVVPLPGYAPDINPVEGLWGNIQRRELANRSVKDLSEMMEGVRNGFTRLHSENYLLHAFLDHAGLSLD